MLDFNKFDILIFYYYGDSLSFKKKNFIDFKNFFIFILVFCMCEIVMLSNGVFKLCLF